MNFYHKIVELTIFIIVQILPWGTVCLGHYWSREQGWPAPRWLRILFGDFRKQGDLNKSSVLWQLVVYIFIIIFIVYELTSESTPGGRAIIIFTEYFIGFVLAEVISSKWRARNSSR